MALLLAQICPQTRERAANALARCRFIHPTRDRELAKAQLTLEAEDDRLAFARLQLRERGARSPRAFSLDGEVGRVAPAVGVVHQAQARVASLPRLGVPPADAPGDPEQPGADAAVASVLGERI